MNVRVIKSGVAEDVRKCQLQFLMCDIVSAVNFKKQIQYKTSV